MTFILLAAFALTVGAADAGAAALAVRSQDQPPPPYALPAPTVERFAAQAAHGLTFGPEGRLYISGGRRISQLTPDGAISLLAELPETSAETPRVWNLAWHDGQLFGAAHDRIVRIAADGTVTNLIEEAFPGPCGVTDLVFDARGNLYVAYDRQIACYTPDLKKRVVLDGAKTNPVMRWITSLCIDRQGRLWISDVRRKRVFLAELDTDGMLQVKRVFDLPEHPEYLAVAGNGTVYVGFPDANSIARLDDGGTHRMIPLGGQLNYPVGMSFGGSGFERDVLFIASRSGVHLVRLAPDSLERSP